MSHYLLDTNFCILLLKSPPRLAVERLKGVKPSSLSASSITAAELRFGANKSAHPRRNHRRLDTFFESIRVLPFDQAAADKYGGVRSKLERAKTPIGPLDTLIAAHALATGAVLVTNKVREFKRVRGLKVEDWSV
jgi:tRNA(fMet)-specific endonuclease VapC